ncbi:hypothetical protein AB6D11_03760 [Vibrio splendidus]
MRAGREEKQMRVNEIRDAKSLKSRYKELDEGNGIRDAKGKKAILLSSALRYSFTRIPYLPLSSLLLVYPHPASAFKLFATRLPVSRICSYL